MCAEIAKGESPLFHVNDETETGNSAHDTTAQPVSPLFHVNNKAETSGEVPRTSGVVWTGRVLTGLSALFLVFDAVGKIMLPKQVLDASSRLGFPLSLIPGVGILLLLITIVYVIPRTAVLGAVLITGFLGGAMAIQMRAGSPTFELLFPLIFALVVWGGVYLRECRLHRILPLRR